MDVNERTPVRFLNVLMNSYSSVPTRPASASNRFPAPTRRGAWLGGRASRSVVAVIAWILGSVLVPIAVEAAGAYVTPGTGTAVYDNSEMVQFAGAGCTSSNEFGNEVLLAPAGADGSRTIGSIHVPFFCYSKDPKAPLGFLRFRLYHNNGPGEGSDHPPGDILLDSGPVQAALGKDYNTLVLDGLRLTNVPNRVTWTVEFTGVSATVTMQLLLIEPPVLGHAFDECWVKRPAGWRTQRFLEDLNPLWAVKPVFALRMEALTDAREPSVSVARGAPVPPWTPPVPPYTVLYPDLFVDGADTNRLTPTYPLSLDSASPGYGRVEIEPYVAAEYPLGTVLTLTAVPAPGCTFRILVRGRGRRGEPDSVDGGDEQRHRRAFQRSTGQILERPPPGRGKRFSNGRAPRCSSRPHRPPVPGQTSLSLARPTPSHTRARSSSSGSRAGSGTSEAEPRTHLSVVGGAPQNLTCSHTVSEL